MSASPSRGPSRRSPLPALLSVTAALCAAVLVGGCSPAAPPQPSAPSNLVTARALAPKAANELEDDYQAVIENVLPSVVQIEADERLGSGIVYDDEGHIVTNAHVVGPGRSFRVTVATGEAPMTARLVSSYPEQDLAVIRLESVPEGLRAATFGDSSTVAVGQIVLAMGSPLGLSSSVTQGIVSAVGRTVTQSDLGGGTGATFADMVQTSAPINPGNSGGALVNLDSEVIGIPTLAAVDPSLGEGAAPGIGFAIPASMVRRIADQIITTGRVTDSGRAALGITGRTVLDDRYAPSGVAVVEVTQDGPADQAGLRAGDIITKVGNTAITTITSLAEALAAQQPGDKVTVTYQRDGSQRTAQVTLGEL
ncbi:trypsin-like peptidase domain-containing protein [Streptomyces sp. ISL-10]|uniref:S1C family serine protease n=1 Tax=Streptomyces sp. ISL-10 TaxID=2819172 RepID=UPI001BE9903A|nr:trypsin-like peptidase domain-containing protein [Streptomyces sp. ISL-10]MBT2366473.1 trypsin-like peptidase domain-containing protein [Streptomyces sp. ISL-10]